MEKISAQFNEARSILDAFIADKANFDKILKAGQAMVGALKHDGKIISCGNGGSMSDAMHFAEELTGRFKNDRPALAALSISDPSHISCVANDYGYEYIFSRFIEAHGKAGDVLLAISTSGHSQNVIHAITAAKAKNMLVIGLTGKTGGHMAPLCDIEIRAPHSEYADRAQEIHIKIIHSLIDYIERNI